MLKTKIEVFRAVDTYYEVVRILPSNMREALSSFEGFIQDVPFSDRATNNYEVSEEAARRIDLLNSPHAAVILRVHALQTINDLKAMTKRRHHK